MMTQSFKASRLFLLCLSLGYGCARAQAMPADDLPADLDASAAAFSAQVQTLYLDVTLNQAAAGQLVPFEMRDGQLWADAQDLRKLGLRWPGSDQATQMLALQSIPGLKAQYDVQSQRVALEVPLEALDRPSAQLSASTTDVAQVDPASRLPGVVLNYDIYAQQGNGIKSVSGWSEQRLMGVGPGVWSNTMVSRAQSAVGESSSSTVRLDTQWQHNFPDSMLSLTVGDTPTGSVSWSRSTRIGGIRLARNFGLQPYRVTTPLAMVQSEAVLPSTVDLYINGLRQSSQQVQPGQFMLSGIPMLNGQGMAQMVITDINGQRRTLSVPLYGSAQLLQAGLLDWSLELGAVRKDYGLRSFSYQPGLMMSATARYGLTDRLTLESHSEVSADVRQLGGGGVWRVGNRAGVMNAAVVASEHAGQSGYQGSWGYQWNSELLSVSVNSARRSSTFRDVASLYGATLSRGSDQVFAGTNTSWGSFGAGFVRQNYIDGTQSRFANLTWTRQLPGQIHVNVSAVRNLGETKDTSVYVSLYMPLDSSVSLSSGVSRSSGRTQATVGATRAAPLNQDGWGWRVESGISDNISGQAQVSRQETFGRWNAGLAYLPGGQGAAASTTGYAGLNGSLLWTGGQAYARRQIDDAFALVSTDGVPDIPVRLENSPVGKTDGNGYLLLNRLNAYQRNRLSIDTLELPAHMHIERVQADIVPESRSGVMARFAMRPVVAMQASVIDGMGQFLPAGSRIWLVAPGVQPRPLVVGYEGLIYLEDPPDRASLRYRTKTEDCRVSLSWEMPKSGGLLDLGRLVCKDLKAE